jgi:hypothetical protein
MFVILFVILDNASLACYHRNRPTFLWHIEDNT